MKLFTSFVNKLAWNKEESDNKSIRLFEPPLPLSKKKKKKKNLKLRLMQV
jgi:hypothetical protein